MTQPAETPSATVPTERVAGPAPGSGSGSGRGSRWQAFKRAPRAVRWTAWTALGLVVLLLVLAAVSVVVVRRPLPQTDGEIEVPGLSASVEVVALRPSRDPCGEAERASVAPA